ncbi:MAG TPA: alpha/beta fold hydrolase [Labilithrix sp.]|nr:alpha/beta fold hydrolase [Labilithrix sp.]
MKRELLSLFALLPFFAGCLSFHKGPMPGEPATAHFADVDGIRVRYTDTGEPAASPAAAEPNAAPAAAAAAKPTVVLVHGFASALDVWGAVAPVLARTHRVIALDLKGFGWTDRPEGDYSPEAQAKLVLHLLDQRGVSRTAIVAHSWGSSVALAASLQAPERVTKLALYDAWVYEDQLPTFFHWARAEGVGEALFGLYYKQRADERMALAFFDKKFVTEPLVESVDEALDRPGTVAAALAAVRGQDYSDVERRYRGVDKPTLLMWGREDLVTPLKYGERLVRDLPNAKLVTYPRCGHFPMIEALSASNRELVAFLAESAP